MNFVFYFQDLSKETTKKYIEKMISKLIGINDVNFKVILELIFESHFFIKDNSDISSVSLREINRFGKIYNFFLKYLKERSIQDNDFNLSEKEIKEESIILSLYFCYYLKLPTTTLKDDYLKKIKSIKDFEYIKIFDRESKFIADKVLNGEKGYSINKALKENLFCEFICLLNKEPLILCGKPGTSKSLTIKLLINAMQGKFSKNEFFQNYPQIIPTYYQCSLASTSSGVQNVFNRARKKLENKDNKNKNILVLMDEMGIADISKNNPLKVIHYELDKNSDIKDAQNKFSFVGISNYFLDGSKMNRAFNKIIEDSDENDTIKTGKEIANSIITLDDFSEKIIEIISKTYHYYINHFQPKKEIKDFHGFRDFYYLIKYIFYNYQYKNQLNSQILNLVIEGIYRNFGGQEKSIEEIKDKFFEFFKEEKPNFEIPKYENYNVIKCIQDNINSNIDSRYLLLITKNDFSENVLKIILKGKKYIIISNEDFFNFENIDIINLLLKIQIYMEDEIILILKNLDIIYPSLYELFNKSFTKLFSNKNYTRIFHENKQILVYINNKFRIIILLDEKKLNISDKPFLNRFEKHIFNFEILLDKKTKNILNDLFNSLNKFISFKNKDEKISLKNHLLIDDLEIIRYLSFNIIHKKEFNTEVLIEKLLQKLVPLFTQEMIYLLKYNRLEKIDNQYLKLLYKENYNNNYNLKSFISKLNHENKVNVIYTFTKENEFCFNKNIFSGLFNFQKTTILYLDYKEQNKSILQEITNFIENTQKNLLIINLSNELNQTQNYLLKKIKSFIDKFIIDNELNTDKYFIFIVYKNRCSGFESTDKNNNNKNEIIINEENEKEKLKNQEKVYKNNLINLFIDYNLQFIDNLNATNDEIDIENLTGNKNEILENEKSIEKIIDKTFERVIFHINNERGYNLEAVNRIKEKLKKNKIILDLIIGKLKRDNDSIYNYIYSDILFGKIKIEKNENFIKKMNHLLIELFADKLKNLINYLEDDLSLSQALFSSKKLKKNFEQILDKFKSEKKYNGIKNISFGFNCGLIQQFELINIKCKKLIEKETKNEKIEKELIEEIISNSKLNNFMKEDYKLLIKDYLLHFILFILKIKINEQNKKELIINFLAKILQKRFNFDFEKSYEENINNFAKIIVYMESNKKIMSIILFLFLDFIDIISDFIEKFENIYKPYESSNEKYYLKKMIESFIDVINDQGKFTYYFGNNKNRYIDLLKKNLFLFKIICKEMPDNPSIQRIDIFYNLIINDSTNLLEMILKKYIRIEKNILLDLPLDEIKKEINLNFNYYQSISNIFIYNYTYLKYEDKLKVLNTFISDKNLLKFSLSLYKIILKDCNYLNLNDNSENILNSNNDLEEKINEKLNNDILLFETFIYYFEIYHENYYFGEIEKKSFISEKEKYSEILGGNSLERISTAFDFYEDKFNKGIKSLKLVNIIGYIKSYFKYFSSIIYSCNNGIEFFNFNSVANKLHLSTNTDNSMKYLKIYILELIFIQCKKNDNVIKNFIKNNGIDYLKLFIESGSNISEVIRNIKENSINNYFKFPYEIPSLKLLKEKLNNNNDKKYQALKWVLNNKEKIYKLRSLHSINSISNIFLFHLSYKKTRDEIKHILLKDEIKNINYFDDNLMKDYIKAYNSLLDKKDKIIKNNYGDYTLDYFIIDKDNENNSLYDIYQQFIEYQNEFLSILKNYKEYEKYLERIEEIYIQDANEYDILKFNEENLFDIIINCSYFDFNIADNNNINSKNEILIKTEFNFSLIEKKLIEEIISGIKRFISGDYGIRRIKYKGDVYNNLNNEILYDYEKNIISKNLDEKQNERLIEYIKEKNKNEISSFLISLQSLMIFILSKENELNQDNNIYDVITKIKETNENNYKNQIYILNTLFNNNEDNKENENNEENEIFDYNNVENENNSKVEYNICHLIPIFDVCKFELENKK